MLKHFIDLCINSDYSFGLVTSGLIIGINALILTTLSPARPSKNSANPCIPALKCMESMLFPLSSWIKMGTIPLAKNIPVSYSVFLL